MLGISNIEELPEIAFKVIQELNSREFVEILRKITDIVELKTAPAV